jgi:hypothetical protein
MMTRIVGEIRWDLNIYLESLISSPVRSLEGLIRWNKNHPDAQGGLGGLPDLPSAGTDADWDE